MSEDMNNNSNIEEKTAVEEEKVEEKTEAAAPVADVNTVTDKPEEKRYTPERGPSGGRDRGGRGYGHSDRERGSYDGKDSGDHSHRVPKFKRKICRFCNDKNIQIDYKKPELLEKFITDRGKILPRRVTGTCARHQRSLAREIKRARIIALLPFIEK